MNDSIALCVGLNAFLSPQIPRLNGCENDMRNMAAYLTKAGYEVQTATGEAAGLARIAEWMGRAAIAAQRSEVKRIAFSISSHGTQVPDKNADETDKWDEAIATWDTHVANGRWVQLLVDDDINKWLASFPADVDVQMWADSCHSGTVSRAALHYAIRYLPQPDGRAITQPRPRGLLTPSHVKELERAGRINRRIWSACRADQTAADAVIGSKPCGAFTYAWLNAAAKRGTDAQILARTRTLLRKGGFDQEPQVEVL